MRGTWGTAVARIAWGVTAAIVAACDQRAAETGARPEEPIVEASIVSVVEADVPRTLLLTGSLQGDRQSSLAANATGVVDAVRVERGAVVKRGEVLVHVEGEQADLAANEARAQRDAQQAQLTLVEAECARMDRLFQTGAVSEAEHQRQATQCETQRSAVRAAEERLRSALRGARDTAVRAPFDGLVAARHVNVGEYVRPESKVADVVSIDPLRLELTVPAEELRSVTAGLPVTFRVDAWPDRTFEGVLRFVGPSLDPASRALIVEAIVKNPDQLLRPGMFATASVVTGETRLPAVPQSAIRTVEDAAHVFAVREGRAEERVVALGPPARGDLVSIEKGLAANERVIAKVTPDVRDGVRVE